MKKFLSLILVLQILGVSSVYAQQSEDFVKSTQEDLLIVAGGGAGGAIIGLSTLSFTNQPSKHVSNIKDKNFFIFHLSLPIEIPKSMISFPFKLGKPLIEK
jgi:hypothetical protein